MLVYSKGRRGLVQKARERINEVREEIGIKMDNEEIQRLLRIQMNIDMKVLKYLEMKFRNT